MSLADAVNLQSTARIASDNAYSKDDFIKLIKYLKNNAIEIIPELKLLTHQEKEFFKDKLPGLMYNSATYDPRKNEVYDIVFPFIDEVIEIISPKSIHIGHH